MSSTLIATRYGCLFLGNCHKLFFLNFISTLNTLLSLEKQGDETDLTPGFSLFFLVLKNKIIQTLQLSVLPFSKGVKKNE